MMDGEPQDIGAVTTDGDKWTESTNQLAGFSSLEPTLILRSQRVRASMTTCTIHEHLNEAGKRDNPSVKRADCSLSRFDLDPAEYPPLWSGPGRVTPTMVRDCRQGNPHSQPLTGSNA